ncbi:hypothetical protein BDBG_02147 [Blastomyces gilchristii SLH14081]|uniref:Uncharacterized protein n=1 Tax=Blastomyces gilchristii (strain SLH14081) TaxID=559298 RepID=A0A179UF87_BLAGS|nr:uncharacterized protein BDBG_02147 [Blastomyces gilchristii SLH14081]OAT05817.1 hypothetical protein BDBG_02147 [Blastomyces gilchristii SLH14081]
MARWVVRNQDMTQFSISLGAEVGLSCSHTNPGRHQWHENCGLNTFLRTKVGSTCCAPPQFVFRLGVINNATGQVPLIMSRARGPILSASKQRKTPDLNGARRWGKISLTRHYARSVSSLYQPPTSVLLLGHFQPQHPPPVHAVQS